MTTLPPFKESRDKVWNAYFRGEIKPNVYNFCFCGNLCDNKGVWFNSGLNRNRHFSYNGFSGADFRRMELALFSGFPYTDGLTICGDNEDTPNYEEYLFNGMLNAYNEMKKIYIERGLEVDDFQPVKRETKTVSI